MLRTADVLIVGAGIVGAACAREFARRGLTVAVVEAGAVGGGATAASMGHLLVVDDEAGDAAGAAEFALSARSMRLWQDWLDQSAGHGPQVEHARCGSLWLAADAEELALAGRKQAWYAARGIAAELVDGAALARLEPTLRAGLAGALRVPGDGRVYPPKVAAQWLQGCELIAGEVVGFDGHSLRLADGRRLWAGLIVLAAGLSSQRWLPPGWLLPKKGQLAITQRAAPRVSHQLVELGYIKKAHLADQDTVSFNVQPRPDGQLLIGSSRQIGRSDAVLDRPLLESMLALARDYLPGLGGHSLLRCWTGLRPASRDGLPLIGAHPGQPRVWLACGHEGLGITTSLATAELVAELSLGQPTTLPNAAPYAPARLL